jgi:glutamine amidotransferase
MCRHAAYIGPRTAIGPMLTGLDHSLVYQAYQPRELLEGLTVNADGFGFVWYDHDVQVEPARYANALPIWSDQSLPSMGALIHSTTVLAAVRSATDAGTSAAVNNAPFVNGRWSWSLNGFLRDFRKSWLRPMTDEWISEERMQQISGVTDAEHLFYAFLTRLDQGLEPTVALRSICEDVASHAKANNMAVQLNLIVSNGDRVWATRDGSMDQCNSLYHLHNGEEFPDAHLIASEPLMDDPEWVPIEPGTMMILSGGAPPVRMPIHA